MNGRKSALAALLALYLVLGSWKGYVALYRQNASEPMRIYPNPVTSLPKEDQAALEKGIRVRNRHHLQQLLEDYLS